jgi:hypothetical protein
MHAFDEFYRAGLSHYSEALFAAGCFEMVIVEETDRIMDQKREDIAKSFGVESFPRGGEFCSRPQFDQLRDLTIDNFWAWAGRNYWIPWPSYVFFGLVIVNSKPCVAIMFSGYKRDFREYLQKVLRPTNSGYNYHQTSGETVVRRELEGSATVSEFGDKLANLIDALIEALAKEPYVPMSAG